LVEASLPVVARSRKTDILDAARREFATAGYAGARIERIAAAASVNKQLLFHYFESKEGLFTAALSALLEHAETGRSPGDSPVAQMRRLLGELVVTVRSVPGLVGILADARSNPGFPPAALQLVTAWRKRLLDRLAASVRDGQKRGYFRDDVDPDGVAAIALAAAVGVVAVDGVTAAAPPFEEFLPRLLVDHCAWR
jgi:TetR/AcrR family transcriptional regulator